MSASSDWSCAAVCEASVVGDGNGIRLGWFLYDGEPRLEVIEAECDSVGVGDPGPSSVGVGGTSSSASLGGGGGEKALVRSLLCLVELMDPFVRGTAVGVGSAVSLWKLSAVDLRWDRIDSDLDTDGDLLCRDEPELLVGGGKKAPSSVE